MTKIVFRCDGGTLREVGTGHIMRTLTLARSLVRHGYCSAQDVSIATQNVGPFSVGYTRLCNQGFRVIAGEMPHNSRQELDFLLSLEADIVIIDRLDTPAFLVKGLKDASRTVVVFDDLDDGRDHADLAINAILHDIPGAPNLLKGYEYLVLASSAIRYHPLSMSVERVVVTFGGHDERNLTGFMLDLLPRLPQDLHFDFVIAESSDDRIDELRAKASALNSARKGRVTLHHRPVYFLELVRDADLAVVSGGLTVFECADFGIPSIGVPQYNHQLETIKRLEALGVTKLGTLEMALDADHLCNIFNQVFSDNSLRQAMSDAGHRTVDGRGLERVTRAIGNLFPPRPC